MSISAGLVANWVLAHRGGGESIISSFDCTKLQWLADIQVYYGSVLSKKICLICWNLQECWVKKYMEWREMKGVDVIVIFLAVHATIHARSLAVDAATCNSTCLNLESLRHWDMTANPWAWSVCRRARRRAGCFATSTPATVWRRWSLSYLCALSQKLILGICVNWLFSKGQYVLKVLARARGTV